MENNLFTLNFKHFIFYFIGIFIVLAGLCYAYEFFMKKVDVNYAQADTVHRNNLRTLCDKVDVIFIGDSRCNQGIDPVHFEKYIAEKHHIQTKAFNVGRPGMQTPFFYFILNDLIENKNTRPKVVVMNLSYYLMADNTWTDEKSWMKNTYLSYYKPTISQALMASVNYGDSLLTYKEALKWYFFTRLPFLKFQKKLQSIIEYTYSGKFIKQIYSDYWTVTQIRNVDRKGYLNRGSRHISIDQAKNAPLEKCAKHGKLLRDYLSSLFARLAVYDVHLIIYDFPWPKNFNSKNQLMKHLEDLRALIRTEAQGYPNIHFIDEYFFWDEKYFVDPLHLNHMGAMKLTRYLADHIATQDDSFINYQNKGKSVEQILNKVNLDKSKK